MKIFNVREREAPTQMVESRVLHNNRNLDLHVRQGIGVKMKTSGTRRLKRGTASTDRLKLEKCPKQDKDKSRRNKFAQEKEACREQSL